MDRVAEFTEIVRREVADYNNAHSYDSTGYYMEDLARQMYVVLTVPDRPRPFPARVVVMARIVGDKVVIDEDTTDRPLDQALVRAGIPREQIVRLYAGEAL